MKYVCLVCSFIYDPAVGDIDSDITSGTSFEEIYEGWTCPVFGVGKDLFEPGFEDETNIIKNSFDPAPTSVKSSMIEEKWLMEH